MPLTGGLPLLVGDEIVGGVGSSGGEPEDDLAVCHAVFVALRELPLAG
ncbi:heme-binding protein [Methylobacterium sp. J-030]